VRRAAIALAALVAVAAGCEPVATEVDTYGPQTMEVSSTDVETGEPIPVEHTCDGADAPPILTWSGVPEGSGEVAVLVDDPDAPGGDFTHWVVWGLAGTDATIGRVLPGGAVEGRNDFGDTGYGGPCPPAGDEPHRYRFRVFALEETLDLAAGAGTEEFRDALEGNVLAWGELTATYVR
jgi:Raf kinase inhibitor-like YbhB/YbcL family protein